MQKNQTDVLRGCLFFYSVCWSDFVLAHKSCSHHKAGSSAGNSTDNAEWGSLRDGMINVSALTTCSAQFGPLFISHIPDSSVQNTHWCQPLLVWEGRLRWWEEGGHSRSTSVNLSIIGAPHAKTPLIIKTRRNTASWKGPRATPQTRGCEAYTCMCIRFGDDFLPVRLHSVFPHIFPKIKQKNKAT